MLEVYDNKVGIIQFRENLSTAARNDLLSHRPLSLLVDDEDWDISNLRRTQLRIAIDSSLQTRPSKLSGLSMPRLLKSVIIPSFRVERSPSDPLRA